MKHNNIVLETLIVGHTGTNCYLLGCAKTKEAVIIDPGADALKIKQIIGQNQLLPKYIINTHGHADHMGANKDFDLPIYIHKLDADFLISPKKNLSVFFGAWIKSPKATRLLEEGDKLNIGDITLDVLHTPGHTPGGICLKMDSVIFTGDTLFCGGVGRTDFDYASEEELFKSIKEKLLVLPKDTVIYPGHGPSSTIKEETSYI